MTHSLARAAPIILLSATTGLVATGCLPLSPGTLGDSCEDDSDCFQGQQCAERDGEKVCVKSPGSDADVERDTDAGDVSDTGDTAELDTDDGFDADGGGRDADGGGDTDADGGDAGPSPEGYTVEGTIAPGGACTGGGYTLRGEISYTPGIAAGDEDSGYSLRMTRQRHDD